MIETLLGELSPEEFLAEYWQRKPLLVREAWPGFESPLSPEELAGLGLEEGVTSRLILEEAGEHPWEMRFGPFDEADFTSLPLTHWTLLVQEVDRLVPEVADVLEPFRFVPNWRIDDVQISYAPAHGNAGAHIDSYDVFLLQGKGRRRWKISHEPIPPGKENYVPDVDVRILKDFKPDAEWVLEPGDMLYLPPRIPHHGVALDDCMTYSIGFRAPSQQELFSALMADANVLVPEDRQYQDAGMRRPEEPGEIRPEERRAIREALREVVADDEKLDRWFGRYVTRPRRGARPPRPETPIAPSQIVETIQAGGRLRRSAVAHFAHIDQADGGATLFVCGRTYDFAPGSAHLAALLSGTRRLTAETLGEQPQGELLLLLVDLANEGFLYLDEG